MNNRISSLFAFMIATGIFFSYINPTLDGSIATTKTAIVADDQALIMAKKYNDHQNDLAKARNTIALEDLKRLETFLPDSVNNVGLILDLDALAMVSGLKIVNLDTVVTSARSSASQDALSGAVNPAGSISLSLSAIGTYAAFKAFLAGVEKSARIIDIHDITVKSSDTGVYTYQMKMRVYWLR